jgi:hypothetical protein
MLARAEYLAAEIVILIKDRLMSISTFFYLSLAAWRLASLIANEDGPWMMFKRFRQLAERWCNHYRFCREFGLYELVECEWCNSVWIGVGLTVLYLWLGEAILYLAIPLALSTVVIVIKYIVQILQTAQQFLNSTTKSQE